MSMDFYINFARVSPNLKISTLNHYKQRQDMW